MKRKFYTVITAEAKDGKATMRIVDYIGEYSGTGSSDVVREKIDLFIGQGIKEIDVYLNSRGGNTFEGVEIANQLARIETVSITVGSVAASAATYLTSKFKTKAKQNSQFMIHRPSMGTYGNVIELAADLKLLQNVTVDYKNTYAAKTGKTADEIEDLWGSGDYWMTAQEAKNQGFIDEIEGVDEGVSEDSIAILEACGAPIIPQAKTQNTDMDKQKIRSMLGMEANATDAQVEARLEEMKGKAERVESVEASEKETAAKRAENLAKKAHADKKITAVLVPHYTKLATVDYDSTAAAIEAMQPIPKLSDQLNGAGKGNSGSEPEARKGWTLDDYLDKDPAAYERIKEDDPERAAQLEAAYFRS